MVQENRTVDDLFNGFPGANTQSWAERGNKRVNLIPTSLVSTFDPCHTHLCFEDSYDFKKMDGFDKGAKCKNNCPPPGTAYAYVDPGDVSAYRQIAAQYALADEVFQPNQGPSFPAHQYLIAGQSGRPLSIAENPPRSGGGCDQPEKFTTRTIDTSKPYPYPEGKRVHACLDYATIFDELDAASVSWKYYTYTANSAWTAPEGVKHIALGPDAQNIVTPETTVLRDANSHSLPAVSYVVPRVSNSDHAGLDKVGGGPAWVGTIVNTIEGDPYYANNTAIFILWDDWGGWYDHDIPTVVDDYEYGLRVPMLVVSPYVVGGVDHTRRLSVSIVTFLERLYGLPSLGTTDQNTDDMFSMFTFGTQAAHARKPRRFKPIDTHGKTWRDYMNLPPEAPPDGD